MVAGASATTVAAAASPLFDVFAASMRSPALALGISVEAVEQAVAEEAEEQMNSGDVKDDHNKRGAGVRAPTFVKPRLAEHNLSGEDAAIKIQLDKIYAAIMSAIEATGIMKSDKVIADVGTVPQHIFENRQVMVLKERDGAMKFAMEIDTSSSSTGGSKAAGQLSLWKAYPVGGARYEPAGECGPLSSATIGSEHAVKQAKQPMTPIATTNSINAAMEM